MSLDNPQNSEKQQCSKKKTPTSHLKRKAYSSDDSEKESGASWDSDSSNGVTWSSFKKKKSPEKKKKNCGNESPLKASVNKDDHLQSDSCSNLSKLFKWRPSKCRECSKSQETNQYSCRFYSFRKLRWSSNKKQLSPSGFAEPSDADEVNFVVIITANCCCCIFQKDIFSKKFFFFQTETKLWLPDLDNTRSASGDHLDFHVARFILNLVGDQFCFLIRQEEDATNLHMGQNSTISSLFHSLIQIL